MATTARTRLIVDPTDTPRVWLHDKDLATYVELGDNSIEARHWEGHASPEEFSTFLRALADEIDRAWAEKRHAEAKRARRAERAEKRDAEAQTKGLVFDFAETKA